MNNTTFGLDLSRRDAQIIVTSKAFVDWALSLNTHNRPVKKSSVASYADQMRRGLWELTGQGVGFSKSGYLVDGQHRLIANRVAGYPPIETVVVTGLSDTAQAKVDAHAKRSISNAIGLAKDIWLSNWTCATVRFLGRIDGNFNPGCVEDVIDKYEEYEEAFNILKPYPKDAPQACGFSTAIVCGAHAGGDAGKIRSFLKGVADGIGLGRGDPRLALRNYIAAGTHNRNGKGSASQDTLFCATARALTAWLNDEKMFKIYVPESVAGAAELLKLAARRRA